MSGEFTLIDSILEKPLEEQIEKLQELSNDFFQNGQYFPALYFLYFLYLRAIQKNLPEIQLDCVKIIIGITLKLNYFSECQKFLDRGKKLAATDKNLDHTIYLLNRRAELKILTNFPDQAESILGKTDQLLSSWYNNNLKIDNLILKSNLNSIYGYGEKAVNFARHALEEINEKSHSSLTYKAYRALAFSYKINSDTKKALKYFNVAISNCDIAGNSYDLAQLYFETAVFKGNESLKSTSQLAVDTSRSPAFYLAKAQTLFLNYGSIKDLEKVSRNFKKFGRRDSDKYKNQEIEQYSNQISYLQSKIEKIIRNLLETAIADTQLFFPGKDKQKEGISLQQLKNLLDALADIHRKIIQTKWNSVKLVEKAKKLGVQKNRLTSMLEVNRQLTSINDPKKLLTVLNKQIIKVVKADGCGFYPLAEHLNISAKSKGTVNTNWKNLIESKWQNNFASTISGKHLSYLIVPVKSPHHLYGYVFVDKSFSHLVFSSTDIEIVKGICSQTATLLDNKLANDILYQESLKNKVIVESISDGIILIDKNHKISSINKNATEFLQSKADYLLGKNLLQLKQKWAAKLITGLNEKTPFLMKINNMEMMVSAKPVINREKQVINYLFSLSSLQNIKKTATSISTTEPKYTFASLRGKSPNSLQKIKLARNAATSSSDILITGESGTGKEVFAQAIHNASPNSKGPFVAINCAAIPGELLESELFGYEEGSFTGASKGGKPGKIELAEGGTLLLDEIGDMPLDMQAKILRVIQERQFRRIGGTLEYIFDARIIYTTNRNLDELVKINQFRKDLLYRLRVIQINLPPLRERREDIPILTNHFLRVFSDKTAKKNLKISKKVMQALKNYDWEGNVRELEHIVESLVNLLPPGNNLIERIPEPVKAGTKPAINNNIKAKPDTNNLTRQQLEKQLIIDVLKKTSGCITESAKILELSRGTVYNKIKKFNINHHEFK
ncbi:MAG: sigma 54-interacting transcriptional regulator [Deltaproteobacteria bacterium]|jgi:transcriptional regulator with PAS, ATPase and Fis domain|nr:sigma 54-interacting transcriptional regulator [Deltaproteobacteria bacterium]